MEHAPTRAVRTGLVPGRESGVSSSKSLRRLFRDAGVLFSSIAVVAVLALLASTMRLHRMAHDLGATVESLRLAEDIRAQLLVLQHARSHAVAWSGEARPLEATEASERLTHLAGWASGHVSSDAERKLLDELQTAIRRAVEDSSVPFRGSPAALRLAGSEAHLDEALARAQAVIQFDLDLARAQRQHAGLHRIVAIAAGGVALGLFLLLVQLGRSLGSALFLPLDGVSEAIRSYTDDRGRRAPEVGSTELRHIARTFNLAATELQRQRENQVRFLAGVAHDLGNPLAALRGALDLLGRDHPLVTEASPRLLLIAKRSTDRVSAMVEDLLDVSRVELGELPVVPEQCDLRETVRETAALFEPRGSILQITLPGVCVPAWCDARRIGQVLNNLMSNAIKYSPEGSVICVKARREGETAVIEVIDSGMGVPPDERDAIFEPFRRSSLTRDSVPGVGLGLFISKKLVEAHRGKLTVDSTPGMGSTFRVSLPCAPFPLSAGIHPMAPCPTGEPAPVPT